MRPDPKELQAAQREIRRSAQVYFVYLLLDCDRPFARKAPGFSRGKVYGAAAASSPIGSLSIYVSGFR